MFAFIFAAFIALFNGQTYPGLYDPVIRDDSLPDVLIIGDSISIGYTPYVRTELTGVANVHRVPENASRVIDGLAYIEAYWLCRCRPYDVILFNFGLHDSRDTTMDGCGSSAYTPIADYDDYLQDFIDVLETTNADLTWVSTTDVPEGSACRNEANTALYNAAAATVISNNPTVSTLDLHTPAAANPAWHLTEDVHFTSAGYEALGALVAAHIETRLTALGY